MVSDLFDKTKSHRVDGTMLRGQHCNSADGGLEIRAARVMGAEPGLTE